MDFLQMDYILCYHCSFKSVSIENVLQHLLKENPADELKVRQHMLDSSSGKFILQTKGFGIGGNQCTEQNNESISKISLQI